MLFLACTPAPTESLPKAPLESSIDSPSNESAPDSLEDSPEDSPEDSAPEIWRSELYPQDWAPGYTHPDGWVLQDYSYAGYHEGEEPPAIGSFLHFSVLDYGADPLGTTDSTEAIQTAIDEAAAVGGGVVYLPTGEYRIEGTLWVNSSNLVIAGDGSSSTFLYFTGATGMSYQGFLTFYGALSQPTESLLAQDGEPFDTSVDVSDGSLFQEGDTVTIGWEITEDFIAEHQMTDVWTEFAGEWKVFFRRTVMGVAGNTLTLDVPLRYPVKIRDMASVRLEHGYLTEVGLEDLSVSTVNTWEVAWVETQVHAVLFSGVQDAWVRNVESYESQLSTDGRGMHLLSGGIKVVDSRRVTIQDTSLGYAQNRGDGGNGYLFEISRSNEILTQDCTATTGRHNFIQNWDFGTSGCVWLRTHSYEGRSLLGDWDPIGYPSYSEYHHSLAMANLVDQSEASDGWQGVNRQLESSGAGHAATECVYWNTYGGGYLRSLQVGRGYVIGTTDMDIHTDPGEWDWNNSGEGTSPEDWREGEERGDLLDPPSLYEDQRYRRTGAYR